MGFKVVKKVFGIWILLCLPGILSATCSSSKSNCNSHAVKPSSNKSIEKEDGQCVHGTFGENDSCECNPCWSGLKCQDYVDRFAPRFLAGEPFFILDPIRTKESSNSNQYSNLSASNFFHLRNNNETKTPLFRIEASDDDLGLTCILHQVGPAATCPCATPRYSVVGSKKNMFYADQETGDVFLQDGFSLDPGKYYLVTVQVRALEVINKGYKPWKEKVTATLYIRSKELEKIDLVLLRNQHQPLVSKSGRENGYESEYSSSSSEESSNEAVVGSQSSSFYFPQIKFGEMKSNSIFRKRRQVIKPLEKTNLNIPENIKLYFYTGTSSSLQLQSLSPKPVAGAAAAAFEKIKTLIQVQFPVPILSKHKKSSLHPPVNFTIEVSAQTIDENDFVGIAICLANISRIGSSISFDSTSPRLIADTKYPIVNKVRVDINNLQRIWNAGLERGDRESQIDLEVVLFPYNYFSELKEGRNSNSGTISPNAFFPNPSNNKAHELNQSGKLRVDSQILFPLQKEQWDRMEPNEKVEAFIEIPISERKKTIDLNLFVHEKTKENRRGMHHHTNMEDYGVEISGPSNIPQGKPMPYNVRVYVEDDMTAELRLSLQQVWIENITQDVIEIRKLELVKVGKKVQFCTPFPILKEGFRGECTRNTSSSSNLGRNACFLYSPLLITNCQGRERKHEPVPTDDRLKENVLEFRAIIYGISKPSPVSQFHLEAIAEYKRHDGRTFSSHPPGQRMVVMTESLRRSSPTLDDKFKNLQGSGMSRTTKIGVITGKVVSSNNNMNWKRMASTYQTKPEEPQDEKLLTPHHYYSSSNRSTTSTTYTRRKQESTSSQNVLKITLQKNSFLSSFPNSPSRARGNSSSNETFLPT